MTKKHLSLLLVLTRNYSRLQLGHLIRLLDLFFDPAAILPEPAELKRYNIDDLLADDDLDDASGIK